MQVILQMNFAQLLSQYLRILNISEFALADAIGIDKSKINRWKKGTHPSSNKGCQVLRDAIVPFLECKAKSLFLEAGEKAKTLPSFSMENLLQNLAFDLKILKEKFEENPCEKRNAKKVGALLDEYLRLMLDEPESQVSQILIAADALDLKADDLHKNCPQCKSQEVPKLRAEAFCLRAKALELIGNPGRQLLEAARCLGDKPFEFQPAQDVEKQYRLEIEALMTKARAQEIARQVSEKLENSKVTLVVKESW